MQAALAMQAPVVATTARRTQQTRCQAAPMQQRSLGVVAPKVGAAAAQRNVAAHAKGAIKPMEATFTDFKLVDPSYKVRQRAGGVRGHRRPAAAVAPRAATA